jgi:3-dehydroquinate synthase
MKYILNNQSKDDRTNIITGADAFKHLGEVLPGHTKVAVIADENSAKHCFDEIKEFLPDEVETIILPPGEANKNLKFVEDILRQLREGGFDRKSLLIGLGGGVVNDVVGFVASTYMRGIDWVILPTTLTAQADASIGGKTGVNLGGYKNMVGSFWPPEAVLINPGLLKTLPERHLKNGLAEIIKMGFIYDKQILDYISKIDSGNILGEDLDKASGLAAKAKIEIVNADMYESGERKLLNFGHTIGHALESASLDTDEPLLHGEAISIGMVAETRLAEMEGVCKPGLSDQVQKTLQRFSLPVSYRHAVMGDILEHIKADKKNLEEKIYWTLPKDIGRGAYNHVADKTNIEKAINSIIG